MSIDLSFKNLTALDSSLSLHNHTIINLQGNNFKTEQTYIQQLRVQHLNLSYNNLEQMWLLPPSIITLEINNNLLQNLSNIAHLQHLRQIDLSNNLLQSLHWFGNLPQITHLFLKNNKIKTLESIKNLQNLIEIDVESNELRNPNEIYQIDSLPKITLINIQGNPIFEGLTLQNLNVLEKNCHVRSIQHYQQSELFKKRNQFQSEDLDLLDLDDQQAGSHKKCKSLSPLSKNPQFYDPKASKYITFHEILKQKQKEQQKEKNSNVTATNTTINTRQTNQSLEQLKQQNKELIQEKFKLQQKLQSTQRLNEQYLEEIEQYKLQLQNILYQQMNQSVSDDCSIPQLLEQLEFSYQNSMRILNKQNTEMINNLMNRMFQKIKLMSSQLEITLMKKYCDHTEKTKNLEFNLAKLADHVSEQKQLIVRLTKQRVHSPTPRQCMTTRHLKAPTEIDSQKLKNLFFKTSNYPIEKPLKTQGACVSQQGQDNSKRNKRQ